MRNVNVGLMLFSLNYLSFGHMQPYNNLIPRAIIHARLSFMWRGEEPINPPSL